MLFLAGGGGGSQSNTAEMPVDPFGPVDPFVPIEPVEPTLVVAVARTPTFVKTLNLNTTYTGSGVVFANQDTGYWLDSPFWSTETRARIITHDARTGQALESTTAFHGTEVVACVDKLIKSEPYQRHRPPNSHPYKRYYQHTNSQADKAMG